MTWLTTPQFVYRLSPRVWRYAVAVAVVVVAVAVAAAVAGRGKLKNVI